MHDILTVLFRPGVASRFSGGRSARCGRCCGTRRTAAPWHSPVRSLWRRLSAPGPRCSCSAGHLAVAAAIPTRLCRESTCEHAARRRDPRFAGNAHHPRVVERSTEIGLARDREPAGGVDRLRPADSRGRLPAPARPSALPRRSLAYEIHLLAEAQTQARRRSCSDRVGRGFTVLRRVGLQADRGRARPGQVPDRVLLRRVGSTFCPLRRNAGPRRARGRRSAAGKSQFHSAARLDAPGGDRRFRTHSLQSDFSLGRITRRPRPCARSGAITSTSNTTLAHARDPTRHQLAPRSTSTSHSRTVQSECLLTGETATLAATRPSRSASCEQ